MRFFYHQRCLVTPRAPSKIAWLAWLLKSRRVTKRTYWHVNGTMDRMQVHSAVRERWENPVCDSLRQSYFPKMLPSSVRSTAGKYLPGEHHLYQVTQCISHPLK